MHYNKYFTRLSMTFLISLVLLVLTNCTSLDSSFQGSEEIKRDILKKGKVCSHNLFGGFKLPYIKDTRIRLKGTTSLKNAIDKGEISKPRIIDKYKKNYVLYTKLCTIVYGE